MTAAEDLPRADPGQALASLVEQLRSERDGLRQAMRTRSLIEQAKGILMARDGVTADEAFTWLRLRSQHTNTRLVEVAARLIAEYVPPPAVVRHATTTDDEPARGPTAAQQDGPTRAPASDPAPAPDPAVVAGSAVLEALLHSQHLLLSSRLEQALSYDDVVAAVAATTTGWPAPASVVLALAEPDGALRVVASRGLSAEVVSQWRRVPPQVEVPLNTAARTGTPVWLTRPEQVRGAYPIMSAMNARVLASATLPLTWSDHPPGVLGLSWVHPVQLDVARRSYLLAAAEAVTAAVARLSPHVAAGAAPEWLRALLDGSLTAAALLSPVYADEEVVDFSFRQVNALAEPVAGPGDRQLTGSTVLTAMPGPGAEVLVPLYRAVLADGVARERHDVVIPTVGGRCSVRAARLGSRIFVTWRRHTPGEVLHDDLVAMGRAFGVAAFRWQPGTGELLATPVLAELLNWPHEPAPNSETILRAVEADGRDTVRAAALGTLRHGQPLDLTVAAARGGRWLRVTAERVTEVDGTMALRGWVRDVTELRAARSREHRSAEAHAAHRSRRASLETER